MAEVIPIQVKITPENVEQTKRRINRELKLIERQADRTSKKVSRDMNRGFDGLLANLNKVRLGIIAIAGVMSGVFVSAIVDVNRRMESLRANLVGVEGSVDGAAQRFEQLREIATRLPFSVEEIVSVFIKLSNLGIRPTERLLISFGNTASAIGKSLDQFAEAVADAVVGEFERLKEFGIRTQRIGDQIAFTFRGVTEIMDNETRLIQEYLTRIGEVEFAGAAERQMNTLNGAISNLGDTWSNFLDVIADETRLAKVVTFFSKVIELATDLAEKLQTINVTEAEVVQRLRERQGLVVRRAIPPGQETGLEQPPPSAEPPPPTGVRRPVRDPFEMRGRTPAEILQDAFRDVDRANDELYNKEVERLDRIGEISRDTWETQAKDRYDAQSRAYEILIQQDEQYAQASTNIITTGLSSWQRGFEGFIESGKLSFKGLIDGMISDLARLGVNRLFQILIGGTQGGGFAGLSNIFGGLFGNAKGNVIKRYAKGGLIDKPTIFPARRGMALAGEAGAEAIMPLRRDRQGNLGVSGGNAGVVNNYYINAIDTQSFAEAARRSKAIPAIAAENISSNGVLRNAVMGAR